MKSIILFVFAAVILCGCNAIKPENSIVKLGGHEWQLTAINHKAVSAGTRAYLKFDEKDLEIKGKAFCNTIEADYERMGDNQLTFQEISSTKMYCDGVMDLENQMIANLRNVKLFEIRNGMLYLSDSDDVLLTFKK